MPPPNNDPQNCAIPHHNRPLPGARAALLLLLAINLFNYIDRQVLAAVVPDIAFRAVAALFVLSGIFWLLGARYLARDTQRAESGDDGASPSSKHQPTLG